MSLTYRGLPQMDDFHQTTNDGSESPSEIMNANNTRYRRLNFGRCVYGRTFVSVLLVFLAILVTSIVMYFYFANDLLILQHMNNFSVAYHDYYLEHDTALMDADTDTCTLETCFDFSRCKEASTEESVYIYPPDAGWEGLLQHLKLDVYISFHERYHRQVIQPLHEMNLVTTDPDQACLFVVPIFCPGNRCDAWEGFIPSRLKALSHWHDKGRNHVVFDLGDDPAVKFMTYDAITVRTAAHSAVFRYGFDVQLLLHKKPSKVDLRSKWLVASEQEQEQAFLKRPTLLSFKGSNTWPLREQLHELFHSDSRNNTAKDDIQVLVKSLVSKKTYDAADYNKLMLETKFALVPRGLGTHVHRLMEALSAGCIPIIISDGYVLPTFGLDGLDWRAFSFRFAESEIQDIEPFLRQHVKPEIARRMHANVRDVYPILERGTKLASAIPIILRRIQSRRLPMALDRSIRDSDIIKRTGVSTLGQGPVVHPIVHPEDQL